ncbi:MAG: 4-hydroxyphenylpyruvate dioxygenase [Myxococcales bacterium]|nr:4-hydroxyphenylpyruvate dioxygenase [Myxococcales bacterium]
MAQLESLGIRKIESLLYYVHDLDRVRRFLIDSLDFAEIGISSPELEVEGRQRSAVFKAGTVTMVICQPAGEGGRAFRWLRKHPEGVGTIVFEVDDIEKTFKLLDERGGTMISDIARFSEGGGTLSMFSITTPFGDTTFRFVERKGYAPLFPGMVAHAKPIGGENRFGFKAVDHITTNFQTMAPALLWMEHVLGFERFWTVQFHTSDVTNEGAKKAEMGSGLKSVVMVDPHSPVKFANNEPMRPFFKESQINIFSEDHRGDGVQHAALTVADIISTVRGLRGRGVEFMPTPGSYYDMLPERLQRIGVGGIDEDIPTLRELEILVDGEAARKYLLQIFLKESADLHDDPTAGPFFFEIIQRKGSNGFGAGNFRALFESIERQQRQERGLGARVS